MDRELIRNFSIIAHIDHGKVDAPDRPSATDPSRGGRDMEAQMLDNMDLEPRTRNQRSRPCCTLDYTAKDGKNYVLNLIDTPGHVDFRTKFLARCRLVRALCWSGRWHRKVVESTNACDTYLAIENDLETRPGAQ